MKKILLLSAIGLSLISCRLDENVSPNSPSLDQVGPRKRLTAAQTSTYSVQAGAMNELGNVWMNSWAGNNYYFGNPATKEMNLNIDASFYQGIWTGLYRSVGRLQYMIDAPQAADLPYHTAIAKILKAHYMQYIVDLYGDVPYTEAFKGSDNLTPAYDDDVAIYQSLYAELEEAIDLISNSPATPSNGVTGEEDVIFQGDLNSWVKFANTVKLRYLVRMSDTTNPDAISFRDSKLPSLSGAQFIFTDVTINPGYNSSAAASQNPLYNSFGILKFDGSINTYGWRLYKGSTHMIDNMTGNSGSIVNGVYDDRIKAKFRTVGQNSNGQFVFVGLTQGEPKDTSITSDWTFSGFGGFLANTNEAEGSAVDGLVMTKAESLLLQAEAAVLYPNYFSNGQAYFEEAIRASFELEEELNPFSYYAGTIASNKENYITAIDSVPNAGWSASSDKIAAIQYQRWIALANYNAMETYINYVKTGYPETPLALTAQKSNKPYRLVYPSSEYTSNSNNVPSMTGDDAFSINDFTPFIYK